MDLIYANANLQELGIIKDYKLDLAFGYSENNFELTLPDKRISLTDSQFIYYPNTEYGGIIDSIYEDTYRRTYRYSGRTWQGLLDSKIITPEPLSNWTVDDRLKKDYRILDGDSEQVLSDLIKELELDSLFQVDPELSFMFNGIRVPRYIPFYSGLQALLLGLNAKLIMRYDNSIKKVLIGITTLSDYTTIREWSGAEINYKSEKFYNQPNHLICLGSGELKNRYVIHLYTDSMGGIYSPYIRYPAIMDSDYELGGTLFRYLKGIEEVVEIYDYPNAETRENYDPMDLGMPEDWATSYVNYYKQDSDGSYIQLERTYEDEYEPLDSVPPDWNLYDRCQTYYQKDGDRYVNVEMVQTVEGMVPMTTEPEKWEDEYNTYYEFYSDGVVSEYRKVSSESYPIYNKQTRQPTDWKENKGSYYVFIDEFEYTYEIKTKSGNKWKTQTKTYSNPIAIENSKTRKIKLKSKKKTGSAYHTVSDYAKNIIHTNESKIKWEANKFFTRDTGKKAPTFKSGKYYFENISTSAPTFVAGKYYKLVEHVEKIPPFEGGKIFRKVYDHYGDLVEKGLQRLQDLWTQNLLETDLVEDIGDFDINDLVGNDKINSYITKKILKFTKGVIHISYITGKGGK